MGKSHQLFERLKQKKAYSKFIKDNGDAFLYAMFCILSSKEKEGDKIQFDFYIPSKKKIAYSEYPFDEIKVQAHATEITATQLKTTEIRADLEDFWQLVEKIQIEKKDNSVITKIIGVLREELLDLTCTTQTLDIIRIKVNPKNSDIILYKKENLTNFVQIKKNDSN